MDKIAYFYFDYVSPYSYLAWRKIKRLKEEKTLDIKLKPVLFAGLLNHWGQLGPAEIPPKRKHMFEQCIRYARLMNIPFQGPKTHPFNPLSALRLSVLNSDAAEQWQLVDALWQGIWGLGIDAADESALEDLVNGAGLDAKSYLSEIKTEDIKEHLKMNTQEAIQNNVFGVPTILVDQKLFWGLGDLVFLNMYLFNKDPLDDQKVAHILNRPKSANRL